VHVCKLTLCIAVYLLIRLAYTLLNCNIQLK